MGTLNQLQSNLLFVSLYVPSHVCVFNIVIFMMRAYLLIHGEFFFRTKKLLIAQLNAQNSSSSIALCAELANSRVSCWLQLVVLYTFVIWFRTWVDIFSVGLHWIATVWIYVFLCVTFSWNIAMMATSLHPFRLIPDRFLRRNDVTAMANDVNDNRKHTERRCRRQDTEEAGRMPEVVPLRRLLHVDVPEINSELRPSNSLTV